MKGSLLPEAVVKHAGFVMTHAAVVASVLEPHELICPFVVVTKGNDRQSIDFEAQNQDQAVSEAWSSLDGYKEHIDLWAMAREGFVPTTAGKKTVLIVASWGHGMQEAVVFVQQFHDRGSAFRLAGSVEIQTQVSAEDLSVLRTWFHEGINRHPKAARWWSWANAAQQGAQADHPASSGPAA